MNTLQDKYLQDLLIQSDLFRIVSFGLDNMDWNNQIILFDIIDDFLSNDFEEMIIFNTQFYKKEIDLIKELLFYRYEPLESEYHRLFDIQNGIPYSEGSYIKREKGNILSDVTSFYKAVEFPYLTEKTGSPDTISKETGFICYLFLKEFYLLFSHEYSEQEKNEKLDIIKEIRFKFLDEHYLTWVPQFIDMLLERDTHNFYITIAKILQKLIEKIH